MSTVFAFGTFPDVDDSIDHHVTSASATAQKIRIIMGELLLGNYLEQIQCKIPVRLDVDGMPTAYDNIPVGATPDDIARCTDSDVVDKTCTGVLATCLCQLDAGCGTDPVIPKGTAVGILDANHDGAGDAFRMTPGAVGIHCTGNSTGDSIDVPIDLTMSYWNPSGFQQAPASCKNPPCYDEIGPAVVVQPVPVGSATTPSVPSNSTCGVTFSPDVTSKGNIRPCAAPNGRPPECADVNLDNCKTDQACTPGDTSSFSFNVEALGVNPGLADGDTGISRTTDLIVQTSNGIQLDPGSITNIEIQEVGAGGTTTVYTQYTVTSAQSNQVTIHWTSPTGLAATTQYILTFKTSFADIYHQGPPSPIVFHFTTGT